MNPEYVAYPWRRDLEESNKRIKVLEDLINEMTTFMGTLERRIVDLTSDLQHKVDESSHKAHAAYRQAENVKREVDYSLEDLRRRVRG